MATVKNSLFYFVLLVFLFLDLKIKKCISWLSKSLIFCTMQKIHLIFIHSLKESLNPFKFRLKLLNFKD